MSESEALWAKDTLLRAAVRSFVAMVSQLFSTETDFAAIADEIVGRISDELDYAREARDCEAFARLYKNQDVCVPRVFREFCGPRVLTLSYLPGTKLDEWGQPIQEGLKPVTENVTNDKAVVFVGETTKNETKTDGTQRYTTAVV